MAATTPTSPSRTESYFSIPVFDARNTPLKGQRLTIAQNGTHLEISLMTKEAIYDVASAKIKGLPADRPLSKEFFDSCQARVLGSAPSFGILFKTDVPAPRPNLSQETTQAPAELSLLPFQLASITKRLNLPKIPTLLLIQDLISNSTIWIKIIDSLKEIPPLLDEYCAFLKSTLNSVEQMVQHIAQVTDIYGEMLRAFSEKNMAEGRVKLSTVISQAQQAMILAANFESHSRQFSSLLQESSLSLMAQGSPSQSGGVILIGMDRLSTLLQAANTFFAQSTHQQALLIESLSSCYSELLVPHLQLSSMRYLQGFWPFWCVLVVFWGIVHSLFNDTISHAFGTLTGPLFEKPVALQQGLFYAQTLTGHLFEKSVALQQECFYAQSLDATPCLPLDKGHQTSLIADLIENIQTSLQSSVARAISNFAHPAPRDRSHPLRQGAQFTRSTMQAEITQKESYQITFDLLKLEVASDCQECIERISHLDLSSFGSRTVDTELLLEAFFERASQGGSVDHILNDMDKQFTVLELQLAEYRKSERQLLEQLDQITSIANVRIPIQLAQAKKIAEEFPGVSQQYQEKLSQIHPWSYSVLGDRAMDALYGAKDGTQIAHFLEGYNSQGGAPQWTLDLEQWQKHIEEELFKLEELQRRLGNSHCQGQAVSRAFSDTQVRLKQMRNNIEVFGLNYKE